MLIICCCFQESCCPWGWEWPLLFIFSTSTVWFGNDYHANGLEALPLRKLVLSHGASLGLCSYQLLKPLGSPRISASCRHVSWSSPRFWESGAWSHIIGIACPFHSSLWSTSCQIEDINDSTSWVLNLVGISYESSYVSHCNPLRGGARLLMRVSFLGVVERTREEVEMTHFGNKARWSLPQ